MLAFSSFCWLEKLSEVRAKSPWTSAVFSIRYWYRSMVFSPWVMAEKLLPMPLERAKASMLATLMLMPSCFRGSVSPEMPERSFSNASSADKLWKDAMSPERAVRFWLMVSRASPETPAPFIKAPKVPENFLASSSVTPKDCNALSAKEPIFLAPSWPKVTSTTFWTSSRSLASSTPCLPR